MTAVREDVWDISDNDNPWPPTLLAYATAVREMQAKSVDDPTSWQYQAAIHGRLDEIDDTVPWNTCQHSTWYFLPWHRMYVYQFERIVRSHVVANGGSEDWALPYWDYSSQATHRFLPLAFRQQTLPDGTPNPLWVTQRSTPINTGARALTRQTVDTTIAMNSDAFTTAGIGRPGFGGGQTVAVHFGLNTAGSLELRPHNPVHVEVGGPGGLMTNPDLAALDPIFWLHHCNVDRLWETWLAQGHSNEDTQRFMAQSFQFYDQDLDTVVCMAVGDVLHTLDLGYTYQSLPAVAAVGNARTMGGAVERKPKVAMVGRSDTELIVALQGGRAEVALGMLPPEPAAAARGAGPRFHVQLADVTGEQNPGVVYGVYVNLPEGATPAQRAAHEVGLVSFFGIEHTIGRGEHPLEYVFDVTEVVARLRSDADPSGVSITLLPLQEPEETAAAAITPPVRVGTVAVLTTDV